MFQREYWNVSCSNNVSTALVRSNFIADFSNASHENTTTLEPLALSNLKKLSNFKIP